MGDATIRLDASGNLVVTAEAVATALRRAAAEGGKVGSETERGLRGAMERAREFSRRMNDFLAAGAGIYRVMSAGVDAWASAHESAARRINAANAKIYDDQRKAYEAERKRRTESWENQGLATTLRLSGVQDANAGASIMTSLNELKGPIGDEIRKRLFPAIAQQIASQRLGSGDTEAALQRAAAGLNQFGHVSGYGDAYADLAGTKGMAGREDLSDRALALAQRRARMTAAERTSLDEGLQSGGITIRDDGMLKAKSGFEALAKLVNSLGGLALDPGTQAWNPAAGTSRLTGMHVAARPGDRAAFTLPGEYRAAELVAPERADQVGKDDIGVKDLGWADVKAAFGTLAQQSLAAAVAIGTMAAAARLSGGRGGGGAPSLPGLPGGGGKPAVPGGRGWYKGLGGTAAGMAASAAVVGIGSYLWAQETLDAEKAAGQPDWQQAQGIMRADENRRRAQVIASSPGLDDDDAARRFAAAGDPNAKEVVRILDEILLAIKAGTLSARPEAQ